MMMEIRNLIAEGKTVSITAKGYSMNPFIVHMRDQVVIGPWEDAQIKKGAVILARDINGTYLLHRIVERKGNRLTLMGDGNIGMKETVHTDKVIGLMLGVIKKGRTYSVKSLRWRLYSWFWKMLTPVRRYPLGLWRRLHPQEPLR